MEYLKSAFKRSEKLQNHIRFLYEKEEVYTILTITYFFMAVYRLMKTEALWNFPGRIIHMEKN